MNAKSISYAYPSSLHAAKMGFGDTGCWSVVIYPTAESMINGKILKSFANKKQALAHADTLPQPYTNWHDKYFNQ